jgi:small-conductance mechanosensitive channel
MDPASILKAVSDALSRFVDAATTAFNELKGQMTWVPDWAIAPVLITVALAVALVLHSLLVGILRWMIGTRRIFLSLLLSRTKGPIRLGLIIFALAAVVQLEPLAPDTAGALRQGLLVAFVLLLGWTALIAIDLAAGLYLQRFRLDVQDNLLARKHVTQIRVLKGATDTLAIIVTIAIALMSIEAVRQYGVSLFASAGVAGLIAGLAARPVFSNLIAGVQIAMTQPIRIEDSVIVEGEFGFVEEITSTYVVVRLWDLRRLVVPLSYFIEKPFQNWTRQTSALIGTVFVYLDYTAPVERIRQKVMEIASNSKLWDRQVANVQVSDAKTSTIELRILVSARNAGDAWDLRCEMREKLIAFLQQEHPEVLPRLRFDVDGRDEAPGLQPAQLPVTTPARQ